MGTLFYSKNTIIYSNFASRVRLAGIITKKYCLKSLIYYPEADFPPLGLEILKFNSSLLVILDIHPSCPREYAELINQLREIKKEYPELNNIPKIGFYDPERFFTDSILYGKVNGEWVDKNLPNLLTKYIGIYTHWLYKANGYANHSEFNEYCRIRDPACKLIKNALGPEQGKKFIDMHLFP